MGARGRSLARFNQVAEAEALPKTSSAYNKL